MAARETLRSVIKVCNTRMRKTSILSNSASPCPYEIDDRQYAASR
jgi:hypothetical protein